MRILTLCTYPPMLGGLAAHAAELSEHLSQSGHQVAVVTVDETATGHRVVPVHRNGVAVTRVPPLPGEPADYVARFERQNVRSSEGVLAHVVPAGAAFDLISCHGYFFALSALSVARTTGAGLVFHAHNMMAADVGQSPELRDYFAAVEGEILSRADHVIAISDFIAGLCRDLGCASGKITVIPKALHIPDWDGEWIPQQPPAVLFVGRLSPEKGIETLLHAMCLVGKQVPGVKLLVAGAGEAEYAAQLRELAHDLDLARGVAFLGAVPGGRLPRLYQSAAAAVVPSLMEAFGRVAIEAMAAGCPLVVTDVGGLGPLVRDGETGRKVPAGDPEALADALIMTLTERRQSAVMAGRARSEVVTTYAWPRVAAQTLQVYQRVLGLR
jgi:glycosyltransferase involved in cell wall biosynthesis